MSKIREMFLYAGLKKADFDMLLPEAREENGRFLRIYSIMTTVVFSVCLLLSIFAGGALEVNRTIYIIMIAVSVGLLVCTRTMLKKYPGLSTVFCVVFMAAMYTYSIVVSLGHGDMQGTAAVAILLVMPCIFNYRPICMIVLTILVQLVYCGLSAMMKSRSIALLDLWNSLFFGVIAVLLAIYQMRVKFGVMLQKQQSKERSEIDVLTGTRNRNCFEDRRSSYADICQYSLACIYTDVNGLHELNDSQGHDAGDKMLCTVAGELTKRFGAEDTYRIGGDEFVTFCPDRDRTEIDSLIQGMVSAVQRAGYSVSVGVAYSEKEGLQLHPLIREAELYMYEEKRQYYEAVGHDRRHHGLQG